LITDDAADAEFLRLCEEYCDWSWRPRYCAGPFDFGDEADFRRGIDLASEVVQKRYTKNRPCMPAVARQQMSWRAILYRLKARIDIQSIAEEEVKATGWDRSGYV